MKKYWFTFIEIMVAILVFSIWVFAVLSLVTNNLRWVERNDLRLQGTLFAKEWLELVYNLRDSNLERELPWNCILDHEKIDDFFSTLEWVSESDLLSICDYFGIGSPLKISYFDSDNRYVYVDRATILNDFDGLFSWNQLYYHTWQNISWYSHDSNWKGTFFARYITFDEIYEDVWDTNSLNVLDTWKILKVSSHVIWQKWGYTWEVVLSSFIWNY